MENNNKPIVEIKDLHVQFHSDDAIIHAVNGVDLTIREGETLGLVGETGAGKSIIIGALNLLLGSRADSRQIMQGKPENRLFIIASQGCFFMLIPAGPAP